MGFIESIPSGRMLRRAATTLAGTAGLTMLVGAGVASAAPGDPVSSFGTGGSVIEQFGPTSSSWSGGQGVAVASDGDVYQVGAAQIGGGQYELYIARYLPDGSLDTSFGTGGVTYENVGDGTGSGQWTDTLGNPFETGAYVALTPSGNPLVVTTDSASGGGTQLAVLEFTQGGQLDTSFNSTGYLNENLGSGAFPEAPAIESDGDIVLTGAVPGASGGSQFFAQRLTPSGAVDSSFGTDGMTSLSLGTGPYSAGTSVITQTNGDLVFSAIASTSTGDKFAIVRLTGSGQPDGSFGSGGVSYAQIATGSPISGALGVVAMPGGGYAEEGISTTAALSGLTTAVARFGSDGQLDSSFGNSGIYVLSAGSPESFGDGLHVQADGKLILSGTTLGSSGTSLFVARLNVDGTPDTSFGAGGIASSTLGGSTFAVGLASTESTDGNLFISGLAEGTSTQESFLQKINLDTAPVISFSYAPSTVQAGTPVQFVAAASANDGYTASDVSWDFGGGSLGDATGTSVSHTFTTPGTYTVRAQVTDSFGLSTTASQTITVKPAPAATTTTTTTTTTTPTVLPAVAKAPTLRLLSIRAKHGKVLVKLSCTGSTCAVSGVLTTLEHLVSGKTASLSSGGHGKHTRTVTVGGLRVTLHAGTTRTFTIGLNATGGRLLAAFHRIPAKASFELTNAKPARTIHRGVRIH